MRTRERHAYDRLATMSQHLAKLGKGLRAATGAYNQFLASLESRWVALASRQCGAAPVP